MNKRRVMVAIASLALVVAISGCGKKEIPQQTNLEGQQGTTQEDVYQSAQLPEGHPPLDSAQQGDASTPAKAVDAEAIVKNINKTIDEKFAGEWKAEGTNLKKGDYTENGNYKIADAVNQLYPGSMVSIFVGETRISSTIKQNGQPVLEGYPVPKEVGETMKSGKAISGAAGSMGGSSYQKVYMPIKSGDKTVAVITISSNF